MFYPLDVYMNVVLVNNDIRPAMLIQPADYNNNQERFNQIVQLVKQVFPHLIMTNNYQGVIVSKKKIVNKVETSKEMGHILGYPCADDFEKESDVKYTISVEAVIEEDGEEDFIQIIPNICNNLNKRSQFENIAKDSKKVFHAIGLDFVKDVIVKVRSKVPMKVLIAKLKNNEILSQEDIYELNEMLENYDFTKLTMKNFDITNCIHRGILVGLCLMYKPFPLQAFYPIQDFPNQQEEVNAYFVQWEKDILNYLVR